MKKDFYYLLHTSCERFPRLYVHKILPNVREKDQLVCTSFPEFAERCLKIEEAEELLERVKSDKFLCKYKWEIVKYEMVVEATSWSAQPDYIEYKNLLE